MKKRFNPFKFGAIETNYKGYRMRSRLEARWATFFDTLNLSWEYEKEGFDLEGTWYLPDFWLPEQDCWIEIKGQEPTEEEIHKARKLALCTQKHVYVFAGNIGPDTQKIYAEFAPSLYSAKTIPDKEEGNGKKIQTSSTVLSIIQQLYEVSIKVEANYHQLVIAQNGYSFIGNNHLSLIETSQKQHNVLKTLAPYLEQYKDELMDALQVEDGWHIEFDDETSLDELEILECKRCGNITIALQEMHHIECPHKSTDGDLIKDSLRLANAYIAARQARF